MKRIAITAPVTVEFTAVENGVEIKKPQVLSLFDLIEMICNDPNSGKDLKTVRSMNNIYVTAEHALKSARESFDVQDEDYEAFVRIMRSPAQGFNPFVARKLMPFFDAIEGATKVPLVESAAVNKKTLKAAHS